MTSRDNVLWIQIDGRTGFWEIGVERFEETSPGAIEDAEFILRNCEELVVKTFGVRKESG